LAEIRSKASRKAWETRSARKPEGPLEWFESEPNV
jgi:hypothetical protein